MTRAYRRARPRERSDGSFIATATALFQQHLAHAEYAAPPLPVWPDSPAAEAIENAAKYGIRRDV